MRLSVITSYSIHYTKLYETVTASVGNVVLSVDSNYVQRRVSGSCDYGIASIDDAGTVSCAANNDTNSGGTISGMDLGTGLSGIVAAGTATISVDTAIIQARVTGTCTTGSSIASIDVNGDVTCEVDDNTTYTAGDGVLLTGTVLSSSLGTTIESAEITDGTIVDDDINSAAAISGTKISPDFGTQNIVTTGNVGIGTLTPATRLVVT